MALNISAMSGATSEGTFEENARAWEKGLDAHVTKKLSSRNLKISGRDTREVIGSFRKDGKEVFIANYLVRDGDFAYSLAVVSSEKDGLKGGIAKEFLDSFRNFAAKSRRLIHFCWRSRQACIPWKSDLEAAAPHPAESPDSCHDCHGDRIPRAGTIWGFDSSCNRGWDFGYWGDFNRVKEALEDLSGGRVVKDWSNPDIVLEEFGFEVETTPGKRIDLNFSESDPIRHLRGKRLHDALRHRLRA